MSSTYKVDLVLVVEFSNDVLTEGEANTSIIIAPICHFFIGIGPEQIAEEACVGHVGRPHDVVDSQDFVELGRETAVHAEDLVVNQCSNWQAIKAVREYFPEFDPVATLALVVEAIYTID